MKRESLENLLAAEGEVYELARTALVSGAHYEVWDDRVAIEGIRTIYRRRHRTTRRVGQPSLGFADAVGALEAYDGAKISLGFIDDWPRDGYYFQLFLAPGLGQVVACLAVKQLPRASADNATDGPWEDVE